MPPAFLVLANFLNQVQQNRPLLWMVAAAALLEIVSHCRAAPTRELHYVMTLSDHSPSPLSYTNLPVPRGRRWLIALTCLSPVVATLGLIEGIPRVTRAWGYVFSPTESRLIFPLDPAIAIVFLPVAVATVCLSALLMIAGVSLLRSPSLGMKLHGTYSKLMIPVAVVLAGLIAMIFSTDPVAGPLSPVVFVIEVIWFAAYPAFVLFVLTRLNLDRHRSDIKDAE